MADIRIVPASSIMSFTSSLNYIEKLTQDPSGSLTLYGSGSTGRTDLFSIDGNNGRLFSVSDDLSDSLFSVNTIAGLPVIEAFANNTVVLGQYGQNVLVVTGSNVGIGTAAPTAKLHISDTNKTFDSYGNVNIFTTNTAAADIGGAIALGGTNSTGGTTPYVFGKIQGIKEGSASSWNGALLFGTTAGSSAVTERMRITSAGNVGIGTTSPSDTLTVVGTTLMSTSGNTLIVSSSQANALQVIGGANATNIASFKAVGSGQVVASITTAGILSTTAGLTYNVASISTANVNGEIAYWGAGSVTAGNLYYYDSTGTWSAADADFESTSTGLLGIAAGTGTASTVGMLLRGHARFTANSLYTGVTTIGAKLYVSVTAGGFTQTAPSGTGDVVRIIGYVQSVSNDQIYFCPDNTFVTLA